MKKILCVLFGLVFHSAYAGDPPAYDLERIANECRMLSSNSGIVAENTELFVLSCVTDLIDLDLSATNTVVAR